MGVSVEQEVSALVRALYPGAKAVSVEKLRPDAGERGGETQKAIGYGEPLKVRIVDDEGVTHELVLHTATPNEFGHDRRADRAEEMILAFDTFNRVPRHARAVDVGAITRAGALTSLGDAEDFYLITEFVPGRVYAEDLRRIARTGLATDDDRARVDTLADYLASLHASPVDNPVAWRRAIRDLVGHGECIFGIVDGYGDAAAGAPPERLRHIEERALGWRWKLRDRAARLRNTHGDFHPFNLVFAGEPAGSTELRVLDASRGSLGDPADDVSALAINFPFFALDHRAGWASGLGELWHRFFDRYLAATRDAELLDVIAPFLAFRGLVVCNPKFYPAMAGEDRDRILSFVEEALGAERFDPWSADRIFR